MITCILIDDERNALEMMGGYLKPIARRYIYLICAVREQGLKRYVKKARCGFS